MITIITTGQIKLNSGVCFANEVSDLDLGIKAMVGYHHYFRVGLYEAIALVQAAIDRAGLGGWVAGGTLRGTDMPSTAVRVGQVKVHSGDVEHVLYVRRRTNRP